MPQPFIENRKFLRHKVELEVKTINGQPVVETKLLDISAMGALIEGPNPLSPYTQVDFIYLRPGDGQERSYKAVVKCMRPLLSCPGRYQMGVQFNEIDWMLDQELRQSAMS